MSEGDGEEVLDAAGKALWLIAFRKQQLQHRNDLISQARVFSLRSRSQNPDHTSQPPEDDVNVVELEEIQKELTELSRREEMLRRSGSLQKDPHDVVLLFGEKIFPEPDYDIEYAPPDYDMPSEEDTPSSQEEPPENESVLNASETPEDPEDLDDPNAPPEEDATPPDKLRREADWVKCDTCSKVIRTVTRHRVTDTTWLMCGIFSAVGCVFGCCLIPFMFKYFKDVSHYCPRCKGKISNVPRF